MENDRADLGFGNELNSFDPNEWSKKPRKKTQAEAVEKAATATGFRSREPAAPKKAAVSQRRRRTGRNAQFNIKVKPETIEAFYKIADGQGWGLGETLEYAVELLQKAYPTKSP